MARKLEPGRLIIASHNAGKVREINALVRPYGLTAVSAGELGLPSPAETETTFEGNARIKAHAAAKGGNAPALADDSGLEIDALGSRPGVYSADWAEEAPGGARDFARGMARVREELAKAGATASPARFVCCLCLAWPEGHDEIFLGEARGVVDFPARGSNGFGYDPIFTPEGETKTFGEMDPDRKTAMSHRADAFRQLEAACLK